MGEKNKTYLSGNHNLLRGKSLYSHVRGGAGDFEVIKFNTDHSLTPNIFKEDFDRRGKAALLDQAA